MQLDSKERLLSGDTIWTEVIEDVKKLPDKKFLKTWKNYMISMCVLEGNKTLLRQIEWPYLVWKCKIEEDLFRQLESGTAGKYMKVWRETGWTRAVEWDKECMAIKQSK